jgi:hypothetical protein
VTSEGRASTSRRDDGRQPSKSFVDSEDSQVSADGKTVLVGNMVEKTVQVMSWDGKRLKDTGVKITVNGGSAAVRTAAK